jgi:hypothetical protein
MSSKNISIDRDKTKEIIEKKETTESKPKLKRRNAVANLELTDGYKEFIKYYNELEKKE